MMRDVRATVGASLLTLVLVAAGAPPARAGDADKKLQTMAAALREALQPDDKRIGNVAAEMAKVQGGDEAQDALLDLSTDPVPAVRRAALQALATKSTMELMPAFIQALADDDALVVVDAVRGLSKYEGEWPTQSLARYLGHKDKRVAAEVLKALEGRPEKMVRETVRKNLANPPPTVGPGPYLAALGRFPDAKATKELVKALDDPKLAAYAVTGLGFLGAKAAKPIETWLLKKSGTQPEIAAALVRAVAGFGPAGQNILDKVINKAPLAAKRVALGIVIESAPKAAADLVTKLAGSKSAEVKRVALEVMPDVYGADPTPSLAANLKFKDADVRLLAARAVATTKREVRPEIQQILVERYRLLARGRSSANQAERGAVLEALGRVGDKSAMSELIQALGIDDEASSAIAGLGAMGEDAVSGLLFLIKTGAEKRRPRAVEALARVGKPAVKELLTLLVHRAREVRNVSRRALAEMGDPQIVEPVVALIKDPRTPGRRALVALLARVETDEAYQALRRFADDRGDPEMRFAAVLAMSKQPTEQVKKFLRGKAKEDDASKVRLLAAQVLIGQGDVAAVPVLIGMLGNEKIHIQEVAAFGIGYLAGIKDLPAIAKKLSHPRPNVVQQVRSAVARLLFRTDIKHEDDAEDWLERWEESEKKRPKLKFKTGDVTLPDGTTIPYAFGGNGKPLLVIHGGPDLDHRYVKAGYDRLYRDRMLIYLDLPGRGASKLAPGRALGVVEDAAAAAQLLARLGFRDIDVAGHGYGALVAARLARRHPKLVRRLVLDNAPLPTAAGWSAEVQAAAANAPVPWDRDIKILSQATEGFAPAVRDRFLTIALNVGAMSRPAALIHVAGAIETRPELRAALTKAMGDFDRRADFAELDKPTLLLYGDKSPTPEASKAWRDKVAADNKQVSLKVIGKAGHHPALENGPAFAEAVNGFLR